MAELQRAYWDSCAWLGLINAEPAKVKSLEYIFEAARRGQYEIWTSTLAHVEVFRLKIEENLPKPYDEDSLDKIRAALEQPFVKLIPLDLEIGRKARQLRRDLSGLRSPADAIHLASALIKSVDPLHTWDGSHLLPFDGKLACKNGKLLRICVPSEPGHGPLFVTEG
jgi:predicted nucleic acid-binding protein